MRISQHIRSNVIGYMALFVALSGTAYAVDGPLPGQNQVGSADIINDDVRSVDIRDDTQASGGLTAADLGPDSVGTSEVSPDSLDAVDLNAGSVAASEVSDQSLGSDDLAPSSVGSSEVTDESLGSAELGAGSVGGSEVAADAIGSGQVAPDSLAAVDLAPDSVGGSELAINSVTGTNVFPSSLSGTDIRQDSLSGNDILDGSITGSEIGTGAVGASEVVDRSMGTAEFASSIPAAKVTRTANQSIPNRSNPTTALSFDSERYDTAGMHSPTVNPSHLRAPVTGIYQLTASVYWDFQNAGSRDLALFKNGNTFLGFDTKRVSGALGGGFELQDLTISTVARLAAGDFVQAGVTQTSGDTLDVVKVSEYSPEFSMTWLAPGP